MLEGEGFCEGYMDENVVRSSRKVLLQSVHMRSCCEELT